jgi:hypothetical protein
MRVAYFYYFSIFLYAYSFAHGSIRIVATAFYRFSVALWDQNEPLDGK